jgi:cell division protein FtsL
MVKLNFMLLVVLAACALGLITSQHEARKLFAALEREQTRAQQIAVEFSQLQLEASTWATPTRVERLAHERLQMRLPEPKGVRPIELAQPPAPAKGGVAR